MTKTIFLINGFHSQSTEQSFDYLDKHFSNLGYTVQKPHIDWKYKVMSDNVKQFEEFFNTHKTDYNTVLGFSFGAMIAFISAPKLKPDELYLCSLSPYFKEDIKVLNKQWVKYIGHRRANDFAQFDSSIIASKIFSKTKVFYGTTEAQKYPELKARCIQAATEIKNAKLIIAKDAKHNIEDPGYKKALISVIN